MTLATIDGLVDALRLGCHLVTCWCLGFTLSLVLFLSGQSAMPTWDKITFGPGLLIRIMSGSVVLPQPESVLMSLSSVATKDHTDAHDLGLCLWPSWCPRAVPLKGP